MRVLWFLACCCPLLSRSQAAITEYLNKYGGITDEKKATSYLKIFQVNDTAKIFPVAEYWLDGHLKMSGFSTERKYLLRTGVFTYYYKNGMKSEEGSYSSNNQKLGKWKRWYASGKKMDEWLYKPSDEHKQTDAYLYNFWDSTGVQLVTKGNGWYFFADEVLTVDSSQKVVFAGSVKEGKFDSAWTGFYSDGKKYCVEQYHQGKLLYGRSYDLKGMEYIYDTIQELQRVDDAAIWKFIARNMQYPKLERDNDIQGLVLVKFRIDGDGSIDSIQIIKSVSPGIDKEALRVIKLLPKFTPAQVRGQPITLWVVQPLRFSLQ